MLVDVGDRQLFVDEAGAGTPVLVFEAGTGCASDIWDPVWEGVQEFARVIRYDRANLGQSSPAPTPRSGDEAVQDLNAALKGAGVAGPYILVGHSFGGLLVRLYAHRYPQEVAGIVLLDSSHHHQNEQYLPLLPAETTGEHPEITTLRRLCEDAAAANSEGLMVGHTQRRVAQTGGVGDIPLLVVSRANPDSPEIIARRRPGYPPDVAASLEKLWVSLQADLVRLSSRSRLVIVEGSDHFLHHDRPAAVIEALREFVETITYP